MELDRERSVAEILADAVSVFARYPLLFTALAIGVIAPYELAVLAITGSGPLTNGYHGAGTSFLLLLIRTALITPLISALHANAVLVIGEGREPRLGAVARRGLQALPVVAAAAIMAAGGVFIGFVCLIIPGILLVLRWSVVAQAAALEQQGWYAALTSSGRLTYKRYGQVLGLLFITGVLTFIVTLTIRAIPLGSTSGIASVIVGIAVETVLASFSALTLALLYFSLRARPNLPDRSPRIL